MGTAYSKKHKVKKTKESQDQFNNGNTRINTENGEVEIVNEPTSGVFRRHGSYSVSSSNDVNTNMAVQQTGSLGKASTYVMSSKIDVKSQKTPKNLVDAIQYQCSPDVLKSFIHDKTDCNFMWMQQARPLHLAVRTNQIAHVRTLLSAGALVDLPDANGNSPLLVACMNGHCEVMKVLIEAGASVNYENKQGERTLHFSVAANSKRVIEALVHHGAEVNAQDRNGNTALIKACRQGHINVINELLNQGADISLVEKTFGRSALHYAAYYCPSDIVTRLIDLGADIDLVDNIGDAPFVAAIKGKNASSLEVLLERGCDVYNVDGLNTTALGLACRVGDVGCVRVLLRYRQDPDETSSFGITPLILSVLLSRADIVKELLQNGADPNKTGRMGETPIVHVFFKITPCVVEARHDILRELIRHGANVNHVMQTAGYFALCPGKDNHSILVYAISSGYISMVKMLLYAGADLSYEEIFDWLVAGSMHGCKCIIHAHYHADQIQEPVVKWFSRIRPLKILCRQAIRRHLQPPYPENIQQLPTAKPLQDFLDFSDFHHIEPHKANLKPEAKEENSVVPIHISFLPSEALQETEIGY